MIGHTGLPGGERAEEHSASNQKTHVREEILSFPPLPLLSLLGAVAH